MLQSGRRLRFRPRRAGNFRIVRLIVWFAAKEVTKALEFRLATSWLQHMLSIPQTGLVVHWIIFEVAYPQVGRVHFRSITC